MAELLDMGRVVLVFCWLYFFLVFIEYVLS